MRNVSEAIEATNTGPNITSGKASSSLILKGISCKAGVRRRGRGGGGGRAGGERGGEKEDNGCSSENQI